MTIVMVAYLSVFIANIIWIGLWMHERKLKNRYRSQNYDLEIYRGALEVKIMHLEEINLSLNRVINNHNLQTKVGAIKHEH